MGDFFKPWRRKIGVVTLCLACIAMAGWIRSQFAFDNVDVIVNDQTYVTGLSCIHGIGWSKSHYRKLKLPTTMQSVRYRTSEQPSGPIMVEHDDEVTDVSRNLFVIYVDEVHADPQSQTVIIRYFVIAIPLTLLAACLFLSRPRQPKRISPHGTST